MSIRFVPAIDDLDRADGRVEVFDGDDFQFGVEFLRGRPAVRSAEVPQKGYRTCIQVFADAVRRERDEEAKRQRAETEVEDGADPPPSEASDE